MMIPAQFFSGEAARARVCELGRPYTLLLPFLEEDMTRGIANAGKCRMELVEMGEYCFPIIVNPGTSRACMTLSAYCGFIRAAAEEVGRSTITPFIRLPAVLGLHLLGLVCRQRLLDRSIFINNWDFMTRMTSGHPLTPVGEWMEPILQRYPDHALLYSVMPDQEPGQALALREAGFQLIPFRTVYIWDPEKWEKSPRAKRKNLKRELRITREVVLEQLTERDDLSMIDPEELRHLYHRVNMKKYSEDNPDLTVEYFRNLIRYKPIGIDCLFSEGRMSAFATWWQNKEQVFAFSLGHREEEVEPISLYRRLMAHNFQRSIDSGLPLNLGAGVGHFKKSRGSTPYEEFLAVYDRHLPVSQRLAWRILGTVYRLCSPFYRGKVMG